MCPAEPDNGAQVSSDFQSNKFLGGVMCSVAGTSDGHEHGEQVVGKHLTRTVSHT